MLRIFPLLLASTVVPVGTAAAQEDDPREIASDGSVPGESGSTSQQAAQDRPGPPPGVTTGGRPGRPDSDGVWVTIGVAPVLSPAFQGSRDSTLSIFPDLRLNYGDTVFASIPDGLGWNAVNQNGWKAGPLAKIRFGRDEDTGGSPFLITGDSDALVGLGDVAASGEVGGFVEKSFGAQREWRLRGEVLQGFGGHDGLVADIALNYRLRAGRTIVSAGPRLSLASGDFMQTYFGIDALQSANSGLAQYDADGGVVSWGIGGSVVHPLTRRSAVTMFTSLERLGNEATNSPLIEERGRATQFTLGIGYGIRFGL